MLLEFLAPILFSKFFFTHSPNLFVIWVFRSVWLEELISSKSVKLWGISLICNEKYTPGIILSQYNKGLNLVAGTHKWHWFYVTAWPTARGLITQYLLQKTAKVQRGLETTEGKLVMVASKKHHPQRCHHFWWRHTETSW